MRISMMVLAAIAILAAPALADDGRALRAEREEIEKKISRYEELLAASHTKEAAHYFTGKIQGLEKHLANLPLAALIRERESTEAVDGLIKQLGVENNDEAFTATVELARLKSPRAVPALIRTLERHTDFYVRLGAATALGDIGHKDGVSSLIDALQDRDDLVRTAAGEALFKITQKDFGFTSGLSRAERAEIQRKYRALQQGKDPNSAGRFSGFAPVKERPATFAEHVKNLSGHKDFYFRLKAATALGKSGRFDAVDPLIQALADKDELVRDAARDALVALTGKTFEGNPKPAALQEGYAKWVAANETALKTRLK